MQIIEMLFKVDRSPTGSGVTARVAVQYAKNMIKLGEERTFENGKIHSTFAAKVSFDFLISLDEL